MSALDCLYRLTNTNIIKCDFRYCLVDSKKNPYQLNGNRAMVNDYNTFVGMNDLASFDNLEAWTGLGISVQASNIIGIDLDHCVDTALDYNSANEKAKDIVSMFKDIAYIEFSFSGKGIRILLNSDQIEDYERRFYIKNSNQGIEFYQHDYDGRISNRYLTITGNKIYDNDISVKQDHRERLLSFLDKYMKRDIIVPKSQICTNIEDDRSIEELKRLTRHYYLRNMNFMEDYLLDSDHPLNKTASDESERDFRILKFLYENITQNEEKLKILFEDSPFFKTKDKRHIEKWNHNENRYYRYIYKKLKEIHNL